MSADLCDAKRGSEKSPDGSLLGLVLGQQTCYIILIEMFCVRYEDFTLKSLNEYCRYFESTELNNTASASLLLS